MENSTLYLAIYGAALATIVFGWDVVKYLKDRPTLQVKTNLRILLGPLGSENKIGIDMINKGKRPITIVASGFMLDTDPSEPNMATIIDTSLPKEIFEGQSHTSFVDFDSVRLTKVLYAWARDATDKEYFSKKRPLIG